jgi:TIR domain
LSSAFISYSKEDEHLAKGLHSATTAAGIDTFLAGISIEPGSNWTDAIFEHLERAKWIFFLASSTSVKSPAVQQELGASLVQQKTIIPILVDITPEELPGWMKNYQAINLRASPEMLHSTIATISEKLKIDKFWSGLVFGAIVAGLMLLVAKYD